MRWLLLCVLRRKIPVDIHDAVDIIKGDDLGAFTCQVNISKATAYCEYAVAFALCLRRKIPVDIHDAVDIIKGEERVSSELSPVR